MADIFVNYSGNDANSGATRALAKLTIGGAITAAATNDRILIGTGIWIEGDFTGLTLNKNLTFEADGGIGTVILDGNATFTNFTNHSVANPSTTNYRQLVVRNYLASGVRVTSNSAATVRASDCTFKSNVDGVRWDGANGTHNFTFENCVFDSNTRGYYDDSTTELNPVRMEKCTFVGNTANAIRLDWTNSGRGSEIIDCIFSNSPVLILASGVTDSNYNGNFVRHDFNNYHLGAVGVTMIQTSSGTRNTLAAVQAIAANFEASGKAADPLFINTPSSDFHLRTTSAMIGAAHDGGDVGALHSVFGVSNTLNATMWTGGVFVNTAVDGGSGRIILSAGVVGTFATDVIDLGSSRAIRRIRLTGLFDSFANFDEFNTDTAPNRWTLEVRASDTLFLKGDALPAYIEKEIGTLISGGFSGRFCQVRVTLRTNNVQA